MLTLALSIPLEDRRPIKQRLTFLFLKYKNMCVYDFLSDNRIYWMISTTRYSLLLVTRMTRIWANKLIKGFCAIAWIHFNNVKSSRHFLQCDPIDLRFWNVRYKWQLAALSTLSKLSLIYGHMNLRFCFIYYIIMKHLWSHGLTFLFCPHN